MACHLFDSYKWQWQDTASSNTDLLIIWTKFPHKLSGNSNQNKNVFFKQYAFENVVYKIVAILFWL